MIGVLSKNAEAQTVEEFFQLFKTQWEFWTSGRKYDVILATGAEIPDDVGFTPLVIFQADPVRLDLEIGLEPRSLGESTWLRWREIEFPVYGNVLAFRSSGRSLIETRDSLEVVGCILTATECPTVRVGYNLFAEIEFLLTHGQPAKNARFATLEVHIDLLRTILRQLGVPFVEVPPTPHGYELMACLTHDVDFVGIRDHKFDATMWGFLFRASLGSLLKALSGRLPWSKCFRNWEAALSLPLVYLGLKKDFWLEFDRYAEIEKDCGATFFFLPFKNVAGTLGTAPAPRRRAAKYDVRAISKQIDELADKGCEIGLHGIDAWQDVQRAQAEGARINEVARRTVLGVRMHWLYWNEDSPKSLEAAGFKYDSTFGYNDAVGFRAGTAQVYRPLNAEHLLELPLVIQDSAMFYSSRQDLSEADALRLCQDVLRCIASTGGSLAVNWHTRSLSPERQWNDFYMQLLKEIRTYRVWFGTASEVVEWFRARRALRFESVQFEERSLRVAVSAATVGAKSSFTIRAYRPGNDRNEGVPCFSDYQLADDGTLNAQQESSLTVSC